MRRTGLLAVLAFLAAACGSTAVTESTTTTMLVTTTVVLSTGTEATTPAVDAAATGFEVLAVGTDVAFMGRVDAVTGADHLESMWRFYRLPSPVPAVDFDEAIVVFYARAEDACPDDITGLDVEGTEVAPVFTPPEGFCAQPLVSTAYAIAINRSVVPERFTAILPEWFPSVPGGYPRVEREVDTAGTGDPDLPDMREITDVAAVEVAQGDEAGLEDSWELFSADNLPAIRTDSEHRAGLREAYEAIGDVGADQMILQLSTQCPGLPSLDRLVAWGPYLTVELTTADRAVCDGGVPYFVVLVLDAADVADIRHIEIGSAS